VNAEQVSQTEAATPWSQRAVVATLAALSVVVAAYQVHRIFDESFDVSVTAIAPAAVALVALAVSSLAWPARVVAIAAASVLVGAWGIVSADGQLPDDLQRAFMHGIGDIMAASWPVPALVSGVGAMTVIAGVAGGLAAEFALHLRSNVCLLPSLALIGVVALLSAPAGDPSMLFVGAYVVTALLLLLSRSPVGRSTSAVWYTAVAVVVAVGVPAVLGATLSSARFDPRDSRAPRHEVAETVTPLARLDEWRSMNPAEVMFTTSSPTPERWRLVGLTRYDGRTWLPADDYRISGRQVATPKASLDTIAIDVQVDQLESVWLPMLDGTVSTSAQVRVDSTASALLPETPPGAGFRYQLAVQPDEVQTAQLVGASATTITDPFVDGAQLSPDVLELASTVTVGARTDFERATRIARYLADQFVLDPTTPPGHSLAELELFLTLTRRGRDEQFVAAYGLLASAVGLPVRIAVGFDTVPDASGTGTVAMSDQVTAWPEIEFEDYGWVRFDPVPTSINSSDPGVGEGAVAPVADEATPPPPTTSPSSPDATIPDEEEAPEVAPVVTSEVPAAAVAGVVIVAIVLAVIVLYVSIILSLKRRRRRRRRAIVGPAHQAVGAFRSGVDDLVDLGVDVSPASTDIELVAAATHRVSHADQTLRPVAELATEAVFAADELTLEAAESSWTHVEQFEDMTAASMGRWRAVRARLSTRSLRRGLPD
jgi:transglutaminase-like putative cysteine protease